MIYWLTEMINFANFHITFSKKAKPINNYKYHWVITQLMILIGLDNQYYPSSSVVRLWRAISSCLKIINFWMGNLIYCQLLLLGLSVLLWFEQNIAFIIELNDVLFISLIFL